MTTTQQERTALVRVIVFGLGYLVPYALVKLACVGLGALGAYVTHRLFPELGLPWLAVEAIQAHAGASYLSRRLTDRMLPDREVLQVMAPVFRVMPPELAMQVLVVAIPHVPLRKLPTLLEAARDADPIMHMMMLVALWAAIEEPGHTPPAWYADAERAAHEVMGHTPATHVDA